MKKIMRYELLREAKKLRAIDHPSVWRSILKSMDSAPVIGVSTSSFIMPWWEFRVHGNLVLAWGKTKEYPGGGEQDIYIIERQRAVPEQFMVRQLVLDENGFPLKADAVAMCFNLTQGEALAQKDRYQAEMPDSFFDIFPQGF